MAAATGAKVLACVLLLCRSTVPVPAPAPGRGLRGRGGRIEVKVLEANLREFLEAGRSGGPGRLIAGDSVRAQRRLARIEASMAKTFQALPKNDLGRLAPCGVRYIVHSYFAKEHGWLFRGLEPQGLWANLPEVQEVNILQDRAPALVEALLEDRQSNRGLSLGDVAAMAGALERLVLDESAELLEAAYLLDGLDPEDSLDEAGLHEVLSSYLLIFKRGGKTSGMSAERHQLLKRLDAQTAGSALSASEFGRDAVLNFGFARRHAANPFVPRLYPFEAVAEIVEGLAQDYGKWQDAECRAMKGDLTDLAPGGSGRVQLSVFYSSSASADYQFTESEDYLRKIGALEETSRVRPGRVRIANYLAGPSNCIASSSYFSVCCLSECEGLMSELEGSVQAPIASPSRLLRLVGNLSSSSVDAPRQLPESLAGSLQEIARRNGGEVTLHGRQFAEWLHLAFPNECPYPHVSEDAAALTPNHWAGARHSASPEERRRHVEAEAGTGEASPEEAAGFPAAWSDERRGAAVERAAPSRGGEAPRIAAQLAILILVVRAAAGGWKAAVGAGIDTSSSKRRASALPLYT